MKGIFHNTAVLFTVLLFSSTVFSKTTIYGLENASHFNSVVQEDFYIQAKSFLHKKKAENYKNLLQTKTFHPVTITHNDRFYRVIIGPFKSSAMVRQAADEMLGQPSKTIVTSKEIVAPSPNHSSLIAPTNKANWYVSVGAGGQTSNFSSTMTVNNNSGAPAPYDQDIYSLKHNNTQAAIVLALGRRWERNSIWFPSFSAGLFYQQSFATNPGDTVMQYSVPEFTNYTYNLNISSNIFLGLFKLNIVQWGRVSPYLLAGMGGAFNRAYDYGENPIEGLTAVRVSPGYEGNTTGQFAYMAGAGLDFRLSQHFLLSGEYQYQNLGHVMSGSGAGTWTGQSLQLGVYHSNTLLLNLTYLI